MKYHVYENNKENRTAAKQTRTTCDLYFTKNYILAEIGGSVDRKLKTICKPIEKSII